MNLSKINKKRIKEAFLKKIYFEVAKLITKFATETSV
jgi:hypothetical protein